MKTVFAIQINDSIHDRAFTKQTTAVAYLRRTLLPRLAKNLRDCGRLGGVHQDQKFKTLGDCWSVTGCYVYLRELTLG